MQGLRTFLSIALFCLGAQAVAEVAEKKIEVFENFGDLVVADDKGTKRYITPSSLSANGNFVVRIKLDKPEEPPPVAEEAPKAAASQEEQIEARKLMFDANQAFFKGDLQKTWDLIEKAEQLDPAFYRIKSMKGSLLYRIGSKDLATALWRESLAINPDQPEIQALLDKSQVEEPKAQNPKTDATNTGKE